MNNSHTPVAGPSRPSRPSHLHTTGSTDMAVKAVPASTPAALNQFQAYGDGQADELDVLPARSGRKLCVRHKQMANQNINGKLQKSLDNLPTSERSAITQMWSTFSNAPHAKRKLILEGILTMCCFSQLSHLSDSLDQIIRIDPFSLLPRELNLRVLGYLDAISLGRAAQVSKSWKALADDDLIWRRMCGQHIDRKCEKCGWGLPLLERKRLKVELKDRSPAAAVSIGHHDHAHDHGHHGHEATKVVTRVEALGGKAPEIAQMLSTRTVCDMPVFITSAKRPAPSSPTVSVGSVPKKIRVESDEESEKELEVGHVRPTRPWKTVYCERLVVERNWRKGRCQTKTLKGHKDGVMCLQYHTSLTNPSYPVLITGSYDRTVRVWNLETGNEIRSLVGHTRAIQALQFDQMLLFTGSMDGTVRMWNWRAGECLRVLEGHSDGVVSLNYNGYLLATGSADSTINVWNFRTGNKFTLSGHEEWVNSVLLWDGKTSPGDMDPTVMPKFTRQRSSNSPAPKTTSASLGLTSVDSTTKEPEIDPGTMLFSGGGDGVIKLWDLATEECIRTFEGHKAGIQTMKLLMIDMSEVEIAEQEHRRHLRRRAITPPRGGFTPASQMSLTPSPPQNPTALDYDVAESARASHVQPRVFLHPSPEELKREQANVKVDGAATRQKKAILATGSLDGTVKLWDVDSGEEKSTLFGHIEGVWGVDMDALRMASASHDRTIKVWDRESGNCEQTLVGHRGAVTSLQLSDDMIVSGSDDGDVMVWNFGPTVTGQSVGVEQRKVKEKAVRPAV